MDRDLEWENSVVLGLAQAFAGLVTENMISIKVQALPDRVTVFCLLRSSPSPEDTECIDDAVLELDIALEGQIEVSSDVFVGKLSDWPERHRRVFYCAKLTEQDL